MSVSLKVKRLGRAQEPEGLHCSHSAVHDGKWGECWGVSSEVHNHLHCSECVQIQVVVTAPESQVLDLTSTCRHITVLDEVDVCCVM